MSAITRKFRFWTAVCLILSLLLNVAPLAAYTIIGFAEADLVVEKVGLAATIFIVLIMTAIAWINKTTMRSRVWILLLGMYFCLHNFITPLIIVAICQVIDEWFISPLHHYCRERYVINKELDRR